MSGLLECSIIYHFLDGSDWIDERSTGMDLVLTEEQVNLVKLKNLRKISLCILEG